MNLRMAAAALAFALLPPPPAEAAAEVQAIETPGGIEVWLVEAPEIPMVALELRFGGGASREPAELAGVTRMMAGLLDDGAGDLDAAAFEAAADGLALRFGASAGRDAVSVSARMLTETLDESVELLRLALTEPRFDADAVERARARQISSIRSAGTDPSALASRAWRAALFPEDPYGRPLSGDEATVARIDRAALVAARERALDRGDLAVGIVGDVTPDEAAALIDRLLADLPETRRDPLGPAEFAETRELEIVELDAPQAVARLVQPGIGRDDPDFFAAVVMEHVLGGGGFASRLTQEVRVERGLTYSVSSFLARWDRAAVLGAQVASDNARVAEAIAVIREEWARMRGTGVSEEELDDAKRYLTGAWPLAFDSNAKIASALAGFMSEGLPPDYLVTRNDLVEAVTLEDVNRVAARLLTPERLQVVVVGQPEGLERTDGGAD
ncbi:MAG TPA: pitrilysin family protein [Paracoccaceae bacterium]|nr:pitrilysin family protein [Paracoccaceae bacterium]